MNTKASTTRTTFSRETTVSTDINASTETVWKILINGPDYPRWTKTILSLDGKIALGEKFNLISSLDSKRTFKLKVKEFIADKKLATGDAMGTRSYTLTKDKNVTSFTMAEKIGGPLFPLFAKMLPSFDESFDQFAADLKKEAEKMAGS